MSGRKRKKPSSLPMPAETAAFFAKYFPNGLPSAEDLERARQHDEEAGKAIIRAIAIRDGYVCPPWIEQQNKTDGPQVRFARELMEKRFPRGEWRQMGIRAVRHACEKLPGAKSKKLPGVDSFARAMGRRQGRR
jgi:hypothetical protein